MNLSCPTIHIIGKKNSGKTTLIEKLVKNLTEKGYRVGALKHSMHDHPIDRPGSDSDRMNKAGAQPVAFWSSAGLGVFWAGVDDVAVENVLSEVFKSCDLLLIESFSSGAGLKILLLDDLAKEEWKRFSNVVALVVNGGEKKEIDSLPVFVRDDIKGLTTFLENKLNLKAKK